MQTLQLQNSRPCFWALCCMAVLQGAEATEIGNNAVRCNMMQQAAVSLNPGVFISFVGRVSLWGSWNFGGICLECIEWVLHTSEGQDLIEVQEHLKMVSADLQDACLSILSLEVRTTRCV